jgi:hypothetical protein
MLGITFKCKRNNVLCYLSHGYRKAHYHRMLNAQNFSVYSYRLHVNYTRISGQMEITGGLLVVWN